MEQGPSGSEPTFEERLTLRVNEAMQGVEWNNLKGGSGRQYRLRAAELPDGRYLHLSQVRDAKVGDITTLVQLGHPAQGINNFYQWEARGSDIRGNIDSEELDRFLDEVLGENYEE